MDPEPRNGNVSNRRFLLALLVGLLFLSGIVLYPFLAAVLFALMFAFLLRAPYAILAARLKRPRLAAGLVLGGLTTLILLPIVLIVRSLVEQGREVAASLQDPATIMATVQDALRRLGLPRENADDTVRRATEAAASFLQGALGPAVNAAVEFFAGLIVFAFLLYYLLLDGPKLSDWLARNMPLSEGHRIRLMRDVGEKVRAIMLGAFLVSILQGVAAGIGWWIFGFPNPVFWGFVMTILAVLPFMGPAVVMVPAAIVAFLQGDTFAGVGILVWAGLVVGLIDNFARPYVVGRGADVHPGVILVGTLGGLAVFGMSGFVLGPLLMGLVEPVLETWHDAAVGEPPLPPVEPEPADSA